MKKVKTEEPTNGNAKPTAGEEVKGGCLSLIVGVTALGIAIYSIYVLCS